MSSDLSEAQNTLLGAMSSFVQAVALQPTIYWKNAAQQGLPFTVNPKVVYRGLGAALTNECGQMGLQFGATGFFKKQLGEGMAADMGAAVLGGAFVGPFASICEVTMIQQQRFGGSMMSTGGRILKDFGVGGILRGATPLIGRDAVYVGCLLGLTPVMQERLEQQGWNSYTAEVTSSLAGGLFAGVATTPLDAASTSMKGDLERTTYGRFSEVLALRAKGGLGVLFGGCFWRTVNIAGTILIANACRIRLLPYFTNYNADLRKKE